VAQERVYVEHHVREDKDRKVWSMREYTSLEDILRLETIQVKLRLADIYAKVPFSSQAQ